jgi:hypothetical protein
MRTTAFVLLALLCACTPRQSAESQGGVTLSVSPGAVSARDSVTLTLHNGTAADVGYNLCSSGLERESAGAWEVVPSERVCTRELRILGAGAEGSYSLRLPVELAPGRYRFLTTAQRMEAGGAEAVRSDPFVVRP